MMESSDDLRTARIPLLHGAGSMPAHGFGTLIPDPAGTITATRDALAAGFRHFDCAGRYRNEFEVGTALQEGLAGESARIKPAVVEVESHPHLPETELFGFCNEKGIVFLAFAPLGHGMKPGLLEDPVISSIAARVGKTPAQMLLAWAVQRGTAVLTTSKSAAHARENFEITALPRDAFDEINRIQTRQRLNPVVNTGVPGFIPQSKSRAQGG